MFRRRSQAIQRDLEQARECLAQGRREECESFCRAVLHRQPDHATTLEVLSQALLELARLPDARDVLRTLVALNPLDSGARCRLGDVLLQLGDVSNARDCFQQVLAGAPSNAEANNGIGIALARERHLDEAATCFRRALASRPEWAVPYLNLGLAASEGARYREAASCFIAAWRLDPGMSAPRHEALAAIAKWTSCGAHASARTESRLTAVRPVSVVFCSIDDDKCRRTERLYHRVLEGVPHEMIAIRDARSLAEAYNRGAEASNGDIVIFSHDDIDILADDFSRRLFSHFESNDVLGVVGGAQLTGPSWSWSGHPHLRGWITHRSQADGWYAAALGPDAVSDDAVLLDGVFIAARRAVLDDVKFDPETFDGFHCYDIDWSYRSWQSGYKIAVAGDLLLVHESRGSYDSHWARYADRFCQKFDLFDVPPPPGPFFVEERLQSEDEVKRFFGLLTEISAEELNIGAVKSQST